MGELGRARVASQLAWKHGARALLAAYAHAVGAPAVVTPLPVAEPQPVRDRDIAA
jgi:hypothetical protein